MKTTLEIDDELYRETKALAALTGRKMKDLVNEALSNVVRGGGPPSFRKPAEKMKLPLIPTLHGGTPITSEQIYQLESTADLDLP
ncbi:hypothetical protein FEM03_22965 [Phragmitibacter flavus]|uniref:Antitoxin n=1 Tax=Phragmitibacter flavus TaxID=2576071 RepID=A0A5R8K7P0_9BACT|nr:type II toxin-antitoxin system VapB family antitoxin [Phragmitibacter flavus]TLD68368.1 hypothetical protein FEM03_22965 [Phragmitibacter flavus]